MAAFVAWNIDGTITRPSSKDASWQIDPRIPIEFQIDNTLYEGTVFDRGHIAKREDLLWGGEGVAEQANDDSFCYSNATPQHEKFNRLAPALWKSLEDEIFSQVDVANLRIALVGGPIFATGDRPFLPPGAPAGYPAGPDSATFLQGGGLPRQGRQPCESAGVSFVAGNAARRTGRVARQAGPVQVPHVPGGRRRDGGADRVGHVGVRRVDAKAGRTRRPTRPAAGRNGQS